MKKNIFFFIFSITVFAGPRLSAQNQVIKLWPRAVPDELNPKHPPVNYTANTSGKNIRRISDITDPDLVVYKPARPNGAALIISPGGGNKYLAVNLEGEEIALWLTSLGYTAFVLEYRVPNRSLGAFEDIQRAVRVVRSRAYEMSLKTDMVGLIGFSAGGNLSARAITGFKKKSYPAQDLADSISCRPDFGLLIYPGSLLSPEKQLLTELKVNEETPPVFIFGAADDPYNVPFSLAVALRDAKRSFEFHVVGSGGHGYGLRPGNPAAEVWPSLAERWLDRILKSK